MKKLFIILGSLGTSFSAIFLRLSDAPSSIMVFYRMAFTCLMLLVPAALCAGEYKNLQCKDIAFSCLSGLFLGMHFLCYFESLKYTSIAASVSLVDTEVFFVSIFGSIFLKEKVSKTGWLCILITFAGSVIVTLGDASSGNLFGDLLALAGAVCSSVYTIIGRKNRKNMSTTAYTFIVYFVAGLVVAIPSLGKGIGYYVVGTKNLLLAFGMAVCCTLLGHSVYSWGLKYEKASFISIAKLMEPVFATLIGILFMKEIPSAVCVFGCVIILSGMVMLILTSDTQVKPSLCNRQR